MRLIVGFFLSVVALLSCGCQRTLPEGDGELVGKIFAYGKPAVGYMVRFEFTAGYTGFEKTDSSGVYVFRLPRNNYQLKGIELGSRKPEEMKKKDSEFTEDSDMHDNFLYNINFDLTVNPKLIIPPIYFSRCVTLYNPSDGSVLSDTSKLVFAWSKPEGASSFKFLLGRTVNQEPIGIGNPVHLISEGFGKDSVYFWAPIDTTIYVRDTVLEGSLVLQHLPKPGIPNTRYFWAVVACDSAGHKITASLHNKYFYRDESK